MTLYSLKKCLISSKPKKKCKRSLKYLKKYLTDFSSVNINISRCKKKKLRELVMILNLKSWLSLLRPQPNLACWKFWYWIKWKIDEPSRNFYPLIIPLWLYYYYYFITLWIALLLLLTLLLLLFYNFIITIILWLYWIFIPLRLLSPYSN